VAVGIKAAGLFGTERSEVRILSPRPIDSKKLRLPVMAAVFLCVAHVFENLWLHLPLEFDGSDVTHPLLQIPAPSPSQLRALHRALSTCHHPLTFVEFGPQQINLVDEFGELYRAQMNSPSRPSKFLQSSFNLLGFALHAYIGILYSVTHATRLANLFCPFSKLRSKP
jgi:hypothetical protein